jgi:hypothetical protein
MAKPNYRHAKRQKETQRLQRQQEKLTRKLARTAEGVAVEGESTPEGGADPEQPAGETTPTPMP